MITQAVKIRWIDNEEELHAVARIERQCFGAEAWSLAKLGAICDSDTSNSDAAPIFKVLVRRGQVVGYVIYRVTRRAVRVQRLAIQPDCQRQGLGRQLLQHLRVTTKRGGYDQLRLDVPERNLPMQLLLRREQFRCTRIQHTADGDLYVFYAEF